MNDLVCKVLDFGKKLGYFAMQYTYSNVYCVMKFFRIQIQKWKKAGEMKKLAKANSLLGAEVYALYRQGTTDYQDMPSVQQQLRAVEAAESEVFEVDGVIEEIKNEYARMKDELKERYSLKRSQVGQTYGEE
jgi:hypothetical protein